MSLKKGFFENEVRWINRVLLLPEVAYVRFALDGNDCIAISETYPGSRKQHTAVHLVHGPQIGRFTIADGTDGVITNVRIHTRKAAASGLHTAMPEKLAAHLIAARCVANQLASGTCVKFLTDENNYEWYIRNDSFDPDEIIRLYGRSVGDEHGKAGHIYIGMADAYNVVYNYGECTVSNRVTNNEKDKPNFGGTETVSHTVAPLYTIKADPAGAINVFTAVPNKIGVLEKETFSLVLNYDTIYDPSRELVYDINAMIEMVVKAEWPTIKERIYVDLNKVIISVLGKNFTKISINLSTKDAFYCGHSTQYILHNRNSFPSAPQKGI